MSRIITSALGIIAAMALSSVAGAATIVTDVSGYNAFIFGDFNAGNSDVEGRLAVGGNANVTAYGIAQVGGGVDLGDTYTLVVGQKLSASNGSVVQGRALAGSASLAETFAAKVDLPSGGNPMLSFALYASELAAKSAALATRVANGTTTEKYGGLTLTGTDSGLNVFNLIAAELSGKNDFVLDAPAGSSALINVSGGSASLYDQGFALNGIDKSRVLFNFTDATSLGMGGIGVYGSILAPYADVSFNNGQMNGLLVAKSFSGGGQMNHAPYEGGLLDLAGLAGPAGVPEPATWALMITGFGVVGAAMRRKTAAVRAVLG